MNRQITKRRKTIGSLQIKNAVRTSISPNKANFSNQTSKKINNDIQIIDDDDDCKIIEQEHPLIIIDMPDIDTLSNKNYNYVSIDPDKLLLKMQFTTSKLFNQYKETIANGIQGIFFAKQKVVQITEISDDLTLLVTTQSDHNDGLANDIFMVDLKPTDGETNKHVVPAYDSSFSEIFKNTSEQQQPNANACQRPKRQNLCFNCDGCHCIRDCPEPKNFVRIRENRAKFSGSKVERYHIGNDQKYSHLQPGIISSELRHALGLRRDELPLHIYQMRLCGYPPGWLENAKIQDSGIALIDSMENDNELKMHESSAKEKFDLQKLISYPGFNVAPKPGTKDDSRYHRMPPMQRSQNIQIMVDALSHNAIKTYKRKKLIDEPVVDETINCIHFEMDIEDVESVPIMPLGIQVNLNQPPLPNELLVDDQNMITPLPPMLSPTLDESYIVIDEVNSPTDEVGMIYGPSLPAVYENCLKNVHDVATKNNFNGSHRCISPTLEDLAEQKRLLLEALEDSSLMNSTFDDSLLEDILTNDSTLIRQTTQPIPRSSLASTSSPTLLPANNTNVIGTILNIPQQSLLATNNIQTTMTKSNNRYTNQHQNTAVQTQESKELILGTPVRESNSLFSNLPATEKWSIGMASIIDYENLPESTGKYNKMKTILNRVRVVIKELNNEE